MESTIARSLMEKVQAKLKEEEAARVELTNRQALELAEEQIASKKQLEQSEKRLEELRKQQQHELEQLRLNKDAEAKAKYDHLTSEIEKEKALVLEAQALRRKAEESVIEVQARLQRELDDANAAKEALFVQNQKHINDLARNN